MSNRPQAKVLARDNLLVSIIFRHKGKQNTISAKEIATILAENGYQTRSGFVHVIVRKVMLERHLPICSVNSKGYFWGETKEELQTAIDDLQGRIEETQSRIEILKSFVIN